MSGERVVRVEAFVLRMPVSRPFGFSQGWVRERVACLVRLETDGGVVGWGECFGPPEPVAAVIGSVLAPSLLGRDVRRVGPLWEDQYLLVREVSPGGAAMAAISGVDIALHDAAGKLAGLPVSSLLGGAFRDRVPAYASGLYWRPDERADLGEYIEEALTYEAAGFRAIKLKVGRSVSWDARLVATVRSCLRQETLLMADANSAYDAREALSLAARLHGVEWLEEPVPPEDLDGYRRVRAGAHVAVAGGEAVCTRYGVRDLVAHGCLDVVQPDTCLLGGLSEAMRAWALASAHGVRYVPHVWGTGLALAANLHLVAALPAPFLASDGPYPMIELDRTEHPFRAAVCHPCPEPADGALTVPAGPGLGVDIDEEFVRMNTRQTVERRHSAIRKTALGVAP